MIKKIILIAGSIVTAISGIFAAIFYLLFKIKKENNQVEKNKTDINVLKTEVKKDEETYNNIVNDVNNTPYIKKSRKKII